MSDAPATTGTIANQGGDVVLDVRDLVVEFTSGRQRVQAVSGVTFQVRRGETLGLVGESGCGKSTTGRTLVQVQKATSGVVDYQGQDLNTLTGRSLRAVRTKIQMIFQDPISSLNPRRRIKDIVAEPLVIWRKGTKEERAAKVHEMLEAVGIDPESAGDRRPGEFSGGQCQRIAIARALATEPSCVVADEPISALDASAQAQIANLLAGIVTESGLGMLFISHDLSVVRKIADRTVVMYFGRVVETGPTGRVWAEPAHPYTRALIGAIPKPGAGSALPSELPGDVPDPARPPTGCRFHPRCPEVMDRCRTEDPAPVQVEPGWQSVCWRSQPRDRTAGPVASR